MARKPVKAKCPLLFSHAVKESSVNKILSENNSIFLSVKENGKLRDIELCVEKVKNYLNRSIEENAIDANELRAPEILVISRNDLPVDLNNVDVGSKGEDLLDGNNLNVDDEDREVVAEIKLLSTDREEVWNMLRCPKAPSLPELREQLQQFLPS